MRQIILISPNDNEISYLSRQWESNAQSMYVDVDKLTLVIHDERIYINCLENGRNEYEDEEMNLIDILNPSFYLIRYSDSEIMEYFLQKSVFSQGSYIDNDLGRIVLVEELRKEDFLDFIS